MLSEKTLKLFSIYYGLASKVGFAPFAWDSNEHVFLEKTSKRALTLWRFWLILIWLKLFYLVYNFLPLYRSGNIGAIVLQMYFLMPTGLAAFYQFDYLFKLKDFPFFFRRMRHFSDSAKEKYFPENTSKYAVVKDGVEGLTATNFVIIGSMALGIFAFGLTESASRRPQLFYSSFIELSGYNQFFIQVVFAALEAIIITLSWTTCLFYATLYPALTACIAFWIEQLGIDDQFPDVDVLNRILYTEKYKQAQSTYRELQILVIHFNEMMSSLLVYCNAAAFINQVGTKYVTLSLYSEMSFGSWLPCPILATTGTNLMLEMQQLFGSVYENSMDVINNSWSHVILKNQKDHQYFQKVKKSCPPLKIMMGPFYHFKKSSSHVYAYFMFQYTITLLLWE